MVAGLRENTLASHLAAAEAGLRWVEVDARLDADGALVAAHDPVVEDGRFIADMSSAETGELGLMRLEELFRELPPEVSVDVEVKTALEDAARARDQTTAARVAELVARESERRRLLVTSFDPAAILIVRERVPAVPIGLLTWNRYPLRKAIPAAVHLGADVVAPHVGSLRPAQAEGPPRERELARSVAVAHDAGLQVLAWCPKPDAVEDLVAAGVDCLVVDDVPAVLARDARWANLRAAASRP